MRIQAIAGALLLAAAGLSGGCASDTNFLGDSLTTASIASEEKAKTSKVDPQCVALMSKIDALRREGTPERIEKVASGKTKTAVVKREALQRISELDRANAEFQMRCSKLTPTHQAAVTTTSTTEPAAVKTVAKPAAKVAASAR